MRDMSGEERAQFRLQLLRPELESREVYVDASIRRITQL